MGDEIKEEDEGKERVGKGVGEDNKECGGKDVVCNIECGGVVKSGVVLYFMVWCG